MKKKYKKDSNTNREIAIKLEGVSKIYTLHNNKPTFSEKIFRRKKDQKFKALDNIDLTIYKGEKVAIIGHNGSGKTTILKIMSSITTPSSGGVKVNGRVISLIGLTAGFHPEMTGRENIYLNGLVIGMSKKEINSKINEIIAFADIGKFIDEPLYTYSAGMSLRLGFSVAVHNDLDILILDEAISAGDIDFKKKIVDKIEEFFNANKTVVFVTHHLYYLERYCDRVIYLNGGVVCGDGGMEVTKEYLSSNEYVSL